VVCEVRFFKRSLS